MPSGAASGYNQPFPKDGNAGLILHSCANKKLRTFVVCVVVGKVMGVGKGRGELVQGDKVLWLLLSG